MTLVVLYSTTLTNQTGQCTLYVQKVPISVCIMYVHKCLRNVLASFSDGLRLVDFLRWKKLTN